MHSSLSPSINSWAKSKEADCPSSVDEDESDEVEKGGFDGAEVDEDEEFDLVALVLLVAADPFVVLELVDFVFIFVLVEGAAVVTLLLLPVFALIFAASCRIPKNASFVNLNALSEWRPCANFDDEDEDGDDKGDEDEDEGVVDDADAVPMRFRVRDEPIPLIDVTTSKKHVAIVARTCMSSS